MPYCVRAATANSPISIYDDDGEENLLMPGNAEIAVSFERGFPQSASFRHLTSAPVRT
jgi:hypothetical protein